MSKFIKPIPDDARKFFPKQCPYCQNENLLIGELGFLYPVEGFSGEVKDFQERPVYIPVICSKCRHVIFMCPENATDVK